MWMICVFGYYIVIFFSFTINDATREEVMPNGGSFTSLRYRNKKKKVYYCLASQDLALATAKKLNADILIFSEQNRNLDEEIR